MKLISLAILMKYNYCIFKYCIPVNLIIIDGINIIIDYDCFKFPLAKYRKYW